MSGPDVTVVLISYNDAERLPRAIRSLQRQTLRSLEIVVVDDASTDRTPEVVRALAESDPRIRYERLDQNSGGCSAPRNRGMSLARGTWVMFCDSDDEYERHACKNLLLAAERLDADIVCGTAERVDVATGRRRRWRPEVHDATRVEAGLESFPELVYDTISVNKIYRRTMLEEAGIAFPEGLLFEDQLFTMEAFAAAGRLAAIPETVYLWYVDRLSDEPSITQRRNEVRNVDSRIEVNRRIDAFLAERGLASIQRIKDLKFLRHDLYLYLSSILEADDDTARELMQRLRPYVDSVNLAPAWEVRPALRVAIYHLLVGDLEGVRAAMRTVKWASVVGRTRRPGGRSRAVGVRAPADRARRRGLRRARLARRDGAAPARGAVHPAPVPARPGRAHGRRRRRHRVGLDRGLRRLARRGRRDRAAGPRRRGPHGDGDTGDVDVHLGPDLDVASPRAPRVRAATTAGAQGPRHAGAGPAPRRARERGERPREPARGPRCGGAVHRAGAGRWARCVRARALRERRRRLAGRRPGAWVAPGLRAGRGSRACVASSASSTRPCRVRSSASVPCCPPGGSRCSRASAAARCRGSLAPSAHACTSCIRRSGRRGSAAAPSRTCPRTRSRSSATACDTSGCWSGPGTGSTTGPRP